MAANVPPYWVIVATEQSLTQTAAPAADRIRWAYTAAAPSLAGVGEWLGPGPKIVRTVQGLHYVTTSTWIWQWNARSFADQATYDAVAREFATRLFDDFRAVSRDYGPPNVGPYSPAAHGSLESWTSGAQAAASQLAFPSRDVVPDVGNPLQPVEAAATSFGKIALILGLVAVGGVVLYEGAQWYLATPRRAR